MVKVTINTNLEGYIDRFDAYKALCDDIGLTMLIDGTEGEYFIEENILYHKKGEYSKNPKTVMLFENLLTIKSIL